MTCPEIDRIIDLALSGEAPQEVQAHLESCQSCWEEVALIREIPAAFRPGIEVPDYLVKKTLAAITGPTLSPSRPRRVPLHGAVSGLLGVVTILIALGVTGAVGSADLKEVVLFSLAVGLAAALNEVWVSARNGPEPS